MRKRNHKSGFQSFLKFLLFIISLCSFLISSMPSKTVWNCFMCYFKCFLFDSIVFFSLPLGDDLASTACGYSNHLAKWNQANFHFQIRWDPASLRMSILYSHKISSGQWVFPYCLSVNIPGRGTWIWFSTICKCRSIHPRDNIKLTVVYTYLHFPTSYKTWWIL